MLYGIYNVILELMINDKIYPPFYYLILHTDSAFLILQSIS